MLTAMNSDTNLFKRIPEQLFRPLSANEHTIRNWALITHLYDDFFAPEAEQLDTDGWTQKTVISSIETFLIRWCDENQLDNNNEKVALNIQANGIFRVLLSSGWLSMTRIGFVQYVVMRPTVQSLFELLTTFAEQGPEFVSGRIQSIRNNLIQVESDPMENAAVFQVAAKECSALLKMLNTTQMRVREASEHLQKLDDANLYLDKFFGEYISSLYIGDYSQLFSSNHPLSFRWAIIELVQKISADVSIKKILLKWYKINFKCKNNERAENLFQSDVSRVVALQDVEKLLQRLKNAVTKANDQALGYFEYKVRSMGDFENSIENTIKALSRLDQIDIGKEIKLPIGWSQGPLFSQDALKPPSSKPKISRKIKIKNNKPSPSDQLKRIVRQIIRGNRKVSRKRVLAYIDRHLPDGGELHSSSMKVESINDLCILASMTRLAIVARHEKHNHQYEFSNVKSKSDIDSNTRITVTDDVYENEYISAPAVIITRKNQGAPKS